MKFSNKFWKSTILKAKCFGTVPENEKYRGLFDTFNDVTPQVCISV